MDYVLEQRDSRRLTGPNLLWEHPGAVLDVAVSGTEEADALLQEWTRQAQRMLSALGWSGSQLTHRRFEGGLSLALSARMDVLYAATEVNEWAFETARERLRERSGRTLERDGGDEDREEVDVDRGEEDFERHRERLAKVIRREENTALRSLEARAADERRRILSDDDEVSIGYGTGARTWPARALPDPDQLDWDRHHEIPVALITGTNGKSTTVRMLAAIVFAAGRTPGLSSTDWIRVGDQELDQGDYSGPGGARAVLRDPRVEVALLETARGGMLRRGLGVVEADVATVLNVAEDHLGEWGIQDLPTLVEVKFIVERAARTLVLNADDEAVAERGRRAATPVIWFSLEAQHATLRTARDRGQACAWIEGNRLFDFDGQVTHEWLAVDRVPSTLGGAARHNVANALAAGLIALQLGLDRDAIRRGLEQFRSSPAENPGRGNLFRLGGVQVLVDFAHNPHGMEALFDMAGRMQAQRQLVLLGQAGDRDEASIRGLAEITAKARPARVIIKEMQEHLRGREQGEVPRMIETTLVEHGYPSASVDHAPSELEAVRSALAWAQDGDLLLLLSHAERGAVLDLLGRLDAAGWQPGDAIPPA